MNRPAVHQSLDVGSDRMVDDSLRCVELELFSLIHNHHPGFQLECPVGVVGDQQKGLASICPDMIITTAAEAAVVILCQRCGIRGGTS